MCRAVKDTKAQQAEIRGERAAYVALCDVSAVDGHSPGRQAEDKEPDIAIPISTIVLVESPVEEEATCNVTFRTSNPTFRRATLTQTLLPV